MAVDATSEMGHHAGVLTTPLSVGVIGGLGLMASPMAVHWRNRDRVGVKRILDRGSPGTDRDFRRGRWKESDVESVDSVEALVRDDLDGVYACCGKNGDDVALIGDLAKALASKPGRFLCHMSTVSARFARAADAHCKSLGVTYVNYPLTGGPAGAEKATMLILCGGPKEVFERLRPGLEQLGKPRWFGEAASAGAEVKLIGHLMVFNGLLGISSAIATQAECFTDGAVGGPEQADFFDYLNGGAGGTTQWSLIATRGIRDDVWTDPFHARYAVIDAIYAGELLVERNISRIALESIVNVTLAFSYLLNHVDPALATHAVLREMTAKKHAALDAFVEKHRSGSPAEWLQACSDSLPEELQRLVALDIAF